MDYFRVKFGEEAAQRFVSGNSPVSQRGKELVQPLFAMQLFHITMMVL